MFALRPCAYRPVIRWIPIRLLKAPEWPCSYIAANLYVYVRIVAELCMHQPLYNDNDRMPFNTTLVLRRAAWILFVDTSIFLP